MTFRDLPVDWAQRPVTDPAITADVLDLVVRDADRDVGSVAALICNAAGRVVQPVVAALPPDGVRAGDRRRFLDAVCGVGTANGDPRGGVLIAVARRRGRLVDPADRAWHDAAVDGCARHRQELLGTWLVTREFILRVDTALRGERSP